MTLNYLINKINKIKLIPISLFVLCTGCLIFMLGFASPENSTDKYQIKTVVIDAGHGGKDDGATGPTGVKEKNIALAVALKLGAKIQEAYPDIKVIYTRKTDVFIELYERANIANRNKADLFISIHLNSSTNPEPSGCEAWVLGLNRTESNLEVAKRENSVIKLEDNNDQNYDLDPNSEAGHIIMSMAQSAYMNQSIDLAGKVVDQFGSYAYRKVRGVKQAGFMVLYKTAMPSTLIEIGFVSNPDEERFLNSNEGQDKISTSILNAFTSYKTGIATTIHPKVNVKTEDTKIEDNKTEGSTNTVKSNTLVVTNETGTITKTTDNSDEKLNITDIKKIEKNDIEHLNTSTTNNTNTNSTNTSTYTTHSTNTTTTTHTTTTDMRSNGIIFRVQFCASASKAVKGDRFNKAFGSSIIYENNGKGMWRYMIGNVTSIGEARQLLAQAKSKGFADAFIVVYENGVRGDINKYNK